MNPAVKQKWVVALTSGEYSQGSGGLRVENGRWCCLGVLSDLAVKSGEVPDLLWRKCECGSKWCQGINLVCGSDVDAGMPVKAVYEWAGLDEDDAMMLADLNDGHRANFGAIALVVNAWL